jgi:membrane-associated protein
MIELLGHLLNDIRVLLDPRQVAAGGYAVITLVVFLETGIAMGVVMPGESLVLVAGVLASMGHLSIFSLMPLLFVAAVAGDAVGFSVGKHFGPRVFTRKKSLFFRPEYLQRANTFYQKFGGRAIVLARFVPVVRTFAPIVAGAANMQYKQFLLFNVVGAALWVSSMLLVGYYLGQAVPELETKLGIVILLVVAISLLVPGAEYLRLRFLGHVARIRARDQARRRG